MILQHDIFNIIPRKIFDCYPSVPTRTECHVNLFTPGAAVDSGVSSSLRVENSVVGSVRVVRCYLLYAVILLRSFVMMYNVVRVCYGHPRRPGSPFLAMYRVNPISLWLGIIFDVSSPKQLPTFDTRSFPARPNHTYVHQKSALPGGCAGRKCTRL